MRLLLHWFLTSAILLGASRVFSGFTVEGVKVAIVPLKEAKRQERMHTICRDLMVCAGMRRSHKGVKYLKKERNYGIVVY
jgi:hypothetical protein